MAGVAEPGHRAARPHDLRLDRHRPGSDHLTGGHPTPNPGHRTADVDHPAGDIHTVGTDSLDISDVDTINSIPGVHAEIRAGTTLEHLAFNEAVLMRPGRYLRASKES